MILPILFVLWLAFSLLLQGSICFVVSLLYMIYPANILHRMMWSIYSHWVGVLAFWVKKFIPEMELDVEGKLPQGGAYILVANHYSWLDILVLYAFMHRRMQPFVFVMKRSLIMMPIIGVVCWGLGHPMLRRDRARKGGVLRDVLTLREAGKKAMQYQYGVMIFPEGSRYTSKENPPDQYKHVLPPKNKGLLILSQQMSQSTISLIDATLVYASNRYQVMDFLMKRVGRVNVHIKAFDIPVEEIETWLTKQWLLKDQMIGQLRNQFAAGDQSQ